MNRSVFLLLILILLSLVQLPASSNQSNVGKPLPPLPIEAISNPVASTAGKPMILEFWATWCPPCRKTIPHLNGLYGKYKDKGLVVLGVTKEDATVVKSFMQNIPMDYSVARDSRGSLAREFGIQGIPHAMLVDNKGTIVWEGHPATLNEQIIDRFLGSSFSAAAASPTAPAAQPEVFRPKVAF